MVCAFFLFGKRIVGYCDKPLANNTGILVAFWAGGGRAGGRTDGLREGGGGGDTCLSVYSFSLVLLFNPAGESFSQVKMRMVQLTVYISGVYVAGA